MSHQNEANDRLFAAMTRSGLASIACRPTQPQIVRPPLQTGSNTDGTIFTVKLPVPPTLRIIQTNNKLVNGNGNSDTTLFQKPKSPANSVTTINRYSKVTVGGRNILLPSHLKNCAIKVKIRPSAGTTTPASTIQKNLVLGCKRTSADRTVVLPSKKSCSLGKDFVEQVCASPVPKKVPKLDQKLLLIRPSNGIATPQIKPFSSPKPQSTSGSPMIPVSSPMNGIDDRSLLCDSPILLPKVPLSVGLDQEDKGVKTSFTNSTISNNLMSAKNEANLQIQTKCGSYDPTDEDLNDESDVAVKTFSDYRPNKLKFGKSHPDSAVETSVLSSIPPPDIKYKLALPNFIIDRGLLTCLQLEAVVYACQRHLVCVPSGERRGYLIGDGPGVGKGRTIAGIIYENYLRGRKQSVWFSVSNDLKIDAERDLRDIGADIPVYALNKMKYRKIASKSNGEVKEGVLFVTYSCLISESHDKQKYGSRMKQILDWCGKNFTGPIVFDECHKAKNLFPSGSTKPTKTGMAVVELQRCMPAARIVYASATGATEPRNMAYMSRIGLWGPGSPFKNYNHFIQSLEKGGVGAMELVAMHLKLTGSYIVRQLSFRGVSFSIEEVKLDEKFTSIYNKCVRLWVLAKEAFEIASELFGAENAMLKTMWTQFWAAHQRFFKYMCISAKVKRAVKISRNAVRNGKCVVIGLQSTGEARTLELIDRCGGKPTEFVSTTRGVFENLIEQHFPAPDRARVKNIFGKDFYQKKSTSKLHYDSDNDKKDENETALRSDSEASFQSDDDYNSSEEDFAKFFGKEFDSEDDSFDEIDSQEVPEPINEERNTVNSIASSLPAKPLCTEQAEVKAPSVLRGMIRNSSDVIDKIQILKKELLRRLAQIDLPNNALDDLIEALGGSENVAEMTGRKGRMVISNDGEVCYEMRNENEGSFSVNLAEKQKFMDGEKNVAIISEAASSGISLHSDRRAKNFRRRLHITLELPWSADRAVQQFGRTHRSNQVNAPEYVFLITELAGERRFASVVAKRLESLGALTHGDRRATDMRDLSQYNVDNKYGRMALDYVLSSLKGKENLITTPPSWYTGDFFSDMRESLVNVGLLKEMSIRNLQGPEKDTCDIPRFLNRILGMEVMRQNALFRYFCNALSIIMQKAKYKGELDEITDIGCVSSVTRSEYHLQDSASYSTCKNHIILNTVSVERGLSWYDAKDILDSSSTGINDGFYISPFQRGDHRMVMLCMEGLRNFKNDAEPMYTLYKPNTGKQARRVNWKLISDKYKKVNDDDAKKYWDGIHSSSEHVCSHLFWRGHCENSSCMVGRRQQVYQILTGSVLAAWQILEEVLCSRTSTPFRMQIVRFTVDEKRLVGLLVPEKYGLQVRAVLETASGRSHCQ